MDLEEAPIVPAASGQSNKPATAPASRGEKGHRKRNICIGILVSIIALVLLIVILALTVFKAKDPKMSLNSITVRDLSFRTDMARLGVDLNVTLDVNIAINNPNKVSMKLRKGDAEMIYRGGTVGVVPIPRVKISSDKTTDVNMTVTLFADRFLSNPQLVSDAAAGSLPMGTKAKIHAKVNILGIKIKVSATSTCDFTLFLRNNTVSDQNCKTKTKF